MIFSDIDIKNKNQSLDIMSMIKGGNLCIIRIICLYKMTFLDETMGEIKVRVISSVLTICSGFAAAGLLLYYNETNAGTFKNLLIDQPTPSGIFLYKQ